MRKDLRDRIIEYNKNIASKAEQAEDLKALISHLLKIAPGQLKKIFFDEEILNILNKYGFTIE